LARKEATHVAWLQLWFGIAGLVGLGLTVYFAARSARAAGDAAAHTAKAVDVEIRIQHVRHARPGDSQHMSEHRAPERSDYPSGIVDLVRMGAAIAMAACIMAAATFVS
jgi:hypothetical protein